MKLCNVVWIINFVPVCHLLRSGVAAIFGPQSAHTASHVQSICDTMEIPHLETRWDYRLRRESCLVNLYPHPTTLSKVRLRHLESLEIRLRKFGKCSRLESISWVNSPDWWSARGELIPKLSPFPVIGTGLTGSHHQSIIWDSIRPQSFHEHVGNITIRSPICDFNSALGALYWWKPQLGQ